MRYARFGESVGLKFNEDQTVKHFPGNTIISKVTSDMTFFEYMKKVQDIIKNSSASHIFSYLPTKSYHMTVIEGVCDRVRNKEHWTNHLNVDTPLVCVDDYFEENFKLVPKLGEVTMVVCGFDLEHSNVILLKPKTGLDAKKLYDYRCSVRENLGLDFPDFETYHFHSSVIYGTKVPTESDISKLDELAKVLAKYTKENPFEFVVNEPNLTFFDDMFYFNDGRIPR